MSYLVLETDTATPNSVAGLTKRVCDKPHGPFETLAQARKFVQADASESFTFHEKMEVGEPETTSGSIYMIVELVQVLQPVPTPRVTWKLEAL